MNGEELRRAWTEIVTAADLYAHLRDNGQAQANARLLSLMLSEHSLHANAALLIAGIGTGQLFDFADLQVFSKYVLTLTDLNESFLAEARKRIERIGTLRASIEIDDVERTRLTTPFDGAAAVLLLEHVDWKLALDSMTRSAPARLYFVLQGNELGSSPLKTNRELAPSIAEFARRAKPSLVPPDELSVVLSGRGYRLIKKLEKPVPDAKTMVGLVFDRTTSS